MEENFSSPAQQAQAAGGRESTAFSLPRAAARPLCARDENARDGAVAISAALG
jgi:hypothetical protein